MLSKYFLPPDVFFRHLLVDRELIGVDDIKTILDVGGSLGNFRKFRKDLRIVTADVVGGDVIYDGDHLPFGNKSFDSVVSIDTLEHVPPAKRVELIGEFLRVAKMIVVAIAPYASPEHLKHEQNLKNNYEKKGKKIPEYLEEHLRYGLVTDQQIDEMTRKYNFSSKLVGSVTIDKINFMIHMFEVRPGKLNQALYLMKAGWNVAMNILLSLIPLLGSRSNASRVMLTCIK